MKQAVVAARCNINDAVTTDHQASRFITVIPQAWTPAHDMHVMSPSARMSPVSLHELESKCSSIGNMERGV